MMRKIVILFIVLSLSITVNAQIKKKFYSIEKGKIKSTDAHHSISKIKLLKTAPKENNKFLENVNIPKFLINEIIFPLIIKNLSKVFYNPKKYVKEHAASLSFLKDLSVQSPFTETTFIQYEREIFNTKNDTIGKTTLSALFQIDKIKVNDSLNEFVDYISINNLNYYYSDVKIKSNAKEVNLIFQIIFKYLDQDHNTKEFKITPFSISKIKPEKTKVEIDNHSKQKKLLPKMYIITKMQIKVSEINSKKKHMDQWFKLYSDNQKK